MGQHPPRQPRSGKGCRFQAGAQFHGFKGRSTYWKHKSYRMFLLYMHQKFWLPYRLMKDASFFSQHPWLFSWKEPSHFGVMPGTISRQPVAANTTIKQRAFGTFSGWMKKVWTSQLLQWSPPGHCRVSTPHLATKFSPTSLKMMRWNRMKWHQYLIIGGFNMF